MRYGCGGGGCLSPAGPVRLLQAGRRSWFPSSPSLVGPFRPRLQVPRQRHAAAAVLPSRCTLAAPLRGPFPAVAPLRSPLRFVFAVYRCVRFFCSFVAAVRSTPSGEAVGGQGFALPGHRFRPPGSLGVDFPAPRSPELLRSSFLLLRTDLVALRKKLTILHTILKIRTRQLAEKGVEFS